MDLTSIESILPKIKNLPLSEQREILKLVEEIGFAKTREKSKIDFITYVKEIWPGFIEGRHHRIMAEAFERVVAGTCKRLIINMAPRHTKSEFASYLLPSWFVGLNPGKKIIQATHTAELAVSFGRKVRNLIDSDKYQDIFKGVSLQSDSKAAGRWSTNKGGEYFSVGVGGAIAGKGADLFIIDDPHTEQDAIMAIHDPSVYDKTFDWYTSGPRQRLQPGAAIVVVMCMVGDTNVLMASGAHKKLKDLRVGDVVATYEGGRLTTSKVNNWRSSGVDSIWTVKTQSGITFQANKRHPFLVEINGKREWIRLQDLKLDMQLVSMKDAQGQLKTKKSQEAASPAKQKLPTTRKILMPHIDQWDTMGSGEVYFAQNAQSVLQTPRAYAAPATKKNTQNQNVIQMYRALIEYGRVMASQVQNTMRWLWKETTSVMFAENLQPKPTPAHIGMESFVSTTAMKRALSEGCFATTAILWSDTEKRQESCVTPLSTYTSILDPIVELYHSGEMEVFDVEVDRTENFIANGIVSHNTRWGKRDLTGRLVQSAMDRDGVDRWEVIELPAIMPSGDPLWPGFWSKEALESLKAELPISKWNAQYQQTPTNEEGAIIKRQWWKRWQEEEPPKVEYVMICADTAYTKNSRSDYSAFTVWGVFQNYETGEPVPNIILLDAIKERLEFPDLKVLANNLYKEWEPDSFLVEAKASGLPLIHELRQTGMSVTEFTPTRASGDKIMRANSISDIIASGVVWAPETKWADEVIEQCAAFPLGANDDLVDTVVMAMLRYRQGGFIHLPTDEYDDEAPIQRRAEYY